MTIADVDSGQILVLAPTGRDGPASVDLLHRAGMKARVCGTLPELIDGLARAGAAFIAEEGLFGHDTSALAAWVEHQPAWSDLPFVILTSRLERPAVVAWRQQLGTMLRNVSLLERPVQVITLTSTVQAAVRARLRQYEVRGLLEAREKAAQELEALVVARTFELEDANRQLLAQMEERARVEETLRQAQKIEALGQLTGGVAHDFNNLLMVILGGLDMLRTSTEPARRQRLIDAMRQAAQRGSGLTRQLLAFSRRQPLNPQPIDLARQLGGMREMLDGSLRGDVEVRLALADDLWAVEVDPGELELALLNLAVNARDAMDNAGTIVVRAENAPGEMVDGKAGDFVRLTVCDTGIGMPPEVQARVFEPFFTTKDIGKGSGLGLAQVYGFAKQSGGTVRIESAIGKGTNVILLLPRSDAAPAPDQRTLVDVRPERPAALSSGWVLLVEDDDEVAALVADMLQQLGYQVTRVGSAAAALGALANGRKVDVVLSDVMMPGGMSGVDLAREIHGRCPGLPVLLSSGYAEAAARAAAIEGVSVLPKPYELGELDLALRQTRQGVAAARS